MVITKKLRSRLLLFTGLYLTYTVFNSSSAGQRESESERERNLSITTNQALEFVHITRTGGRAIEQTGCENGMKWGSMQYLPASEKDNCNYEHAKGAKKKNQKIAPWHTPPRMLSNHVENEKNPFHGAKLFTVVRNPYTRLLSEYHDEDVGYKGEDKNDPEVLNEWVLGRLHNADTMHHALTNTADNSDDHELHHESHYITQIEYVYQSNGTKAIDHVIHYENMKDEFDNLMGRYGFNFTLAVKEIHDGEVNGEILTYKALDDDTIAEINHMAGPDFTAFGYTTVTSFDGPNEYDSESRALNPSTAFNQGAGYNTAAATGICSRFSPYSPKCERFGE